MNANLHLHSRFSDGSQWPDEIAQGAARFGLAMVALTDHDTLAGADNFTSECGRLGLVNITACEIDVVEPEIDYKSEVLGYFPGKSAKECVETSGMLSVIIAERKKRLEYYLYWARTIFRRGDLTFEDVLREKLSGTNNQIPVEGISWSKVDLYLYLKARKLISQTSTYKSFKKEWFAPGRFPKYKLPKPTIGDCVRAIHADGGYAVIPHIGHLWNDDAEEMRRDNSHLASLLSFFKDRGVDGVELYWYTSEKKSRAINEVVRAASANFGFMHTYGSDCHGPGTDKYTIDKFSGDFSGF